MNYLDLANNLTRRDGVAESTMMGSPCLRYKGDFFAMMFEREDSLIVKLPAGRVTQLIADGAGKEFNFTKKTFKEWVLIPRKHEARFDEYLEEALVYAKSKQRR